MIVMPANVADALHKSVIAYLQRYEKEKMGTMTASVSPEKKTIIFRPGMKFNKFPHLRNAVAVSIRHMIIKDYPEYVVETEEFRDGKKIVP